MMPYFITDLFVICPVAPFPAATDKVYSNKQLTHRSPVIGAVVAGGADLKCMCGEIKVKFD